MKRGWIFNKFLFRPSTLMYTKVHGEGPIAEILLHRWVNESVIPPKHSWSLSVIETQNDNYLHRYIILNMHTGSWKSIILNSWLTLYSTDRGRILANMDNYVIISYCVIISNVYLIYFFRQTDPVTAHQASTVVGKIGRALLDFCFVHIKLHPFYARALAIFHYEQE